MNVKVIILALIVIIATVLSACNREKVLEKDDRILTKDDILYFIVVDRFSDGDSTNNSPFVDYNDLKSFQGGDLRGIIDKLDYIKALGTSAIWITPIMQNGPKGYHGYWIYDFYEVDPNFGDLETFRELVREANARGMYVLLDYIVNHVGYNSPWLSDPSKADWFNPPREIKNYRDTEDLERGWLAGLPDLNHDNFEVRNYFINNALWWIRETGVDGFRLDTVKHVPVDFWIEFTQAIKAEFPDFFFLGEVWDDNPSVLQKYHEAGIDSITNYSLYEGIKNGFNFRPNMFSLVNAIDKDKILSAPKEQAIFIDNHDVPRFISLNPINGYEYFLQALTFLYTYPAMPVLYYGTEIAMEGGHDPQNRVFMEWDRVPGSSEINYISTLLKLRKEYLDEFSVVKYTREVIVYEISKGNNKAIIIMNASDKHQEISFEYDSKELVNFVDGSKASNFNNKEYNGRLEPFYIGIYISR